MNRYNSIRNLLIVVCGCLLLPACETNQSGMSNAPSSGTSVASSKNGGHLIVQREANLGGDLLLDLSVDGKHLANVELGSTYDGYLTPGQHVVTALPRPNRVDQAPASVTLTVVNGGFYHLTARWQDDHVILKKDS